MTQNTVESKMKVLDALLNAPLITAAEDIAKLLPKPTRTIVKRTTEYSDGSIVTEQAERKEPM